MKILCDNCGAKYSIADEKVAGRVFKIRCKKCTNIIAVRGDQVAAPAEEQAPAAYDYGSDQEWHVVVDGDQQGPYAPAQLGGMLTDGTIDWEAYVWKEGFDGWKPARDVPELVAAITGEPAPAAQEAHSSLAEEEEDRTVVAPSASVTGGADPFGGGADPFSGAEADPFAGAASGGGADPFGGSADPFSGGGGDAGFGGDAFGEAARAGGDAGADLFASGGDAGFGGGGDVVASNPSPRVSTEQAMTGQRNENSVLFSLSNLQALATGGSSSDSASASSPAPSSGGAPAGHATGEGSGLIDIRALASATAATSGGGGGSAESGVDDLLSIGGGGGGLGPALGAPVLAPAAAEPEPNKKGMMAVVGIAAVLIVGLLGVLIVVLMNKPEEQVAANAPAEGTPATAGAPTEAAAPAPAAPAAPAAPTAAEPATPAEPAAPAEAEASEENSGERRTGSRRRPSRMSNDSPAAPSPMSSPMSSPMTSRMSSAGSDIDDLLAGALGGSMMAAPMMAAAMSNLPQQPGRDDVRGALGRVSSRVQGCGNGTSGVANAAIVFANSGRVRSVRVTGVPPAVQSCVARTVRSARVPPFQRSTFNVTFPFRVR